MVIPPSLQPLIDQALAVVRSHPQHELDWHLRQTIYEALEPQTQSKMIRGRLAILAAQHVTQIFSAAYPNDDFPQQLLNAALGRLYNTTDPQEATELEDMAYHTFGNEFYEQMSAATAGFAAYKALVEVRSGTSPFQNANKFYKQSSDGWQSGTQWTDKDWATIAAVGDAAGTAAVAFSYNDDTDECDPDKLLAFWEWWLIEAVPTALDTEISIGEPPARPADNDAQAHFAAGVKKVRNGSDKSAIKDFDKAIELAPDRFDFYLQRGRARWNSHDSDGALSDFEVVISHDHSLAEAYMYRGDVWRTKGYLENAIQDYSQATQLNPALENAYNNRAYVRDKTGDKAGALEDIQHVLRLNPKRSLAHGFKARLRFELGDFTGAITDYIDYFDNANDLGGHTKLIAGKLNEVIQADPAFAEAYLLRGMMGSWLKNHEQVVADLTQTINLKPELAGAYVHRGLTYIRVSQVANDPMIRNSIKLDPQVVIDYLNQGIADLSEAIRLNANSARVYIGRGIARHKLGDEAGGKADIRHGLEIQPDFPDAKVLRRQYKIDK